MLHTEVNSRPHHTGVAEPAGLLRLGPTVYDLCSFRLKDSSVTSVTLQRAFLLGGSIPPRRIGDGGARHRRRRRVRNNVPSSNDPSRTVCGVLRPSTPGWNRAGSTKTHRLRKVPRTAREATNYQAPKELAVRATRGSTRRPGIGGWDPRSMWYAPFV
jgi:hypothetical protein